MRERWQLARAGLVNFWYYHDEAEFQLSEGRIIFRGPNGSGKSVTMQSFLPLVLDGDKRPWRLDPFGSKDRKIEYYLLLDENSGITDRTGYLYLEFYHPVQDRYHTVGIGLRARRNVPGVSFWGFAVTDNRRVGKDIFLYERDYSQGDEVKIPLTRNRLEEVIGTGGEVVTEPGQYKKLVNNLLFGFGDLQAYQELLDLLIQLRSPKLSKDFKPSTIYEILTAALPALQDDELRPLSEVLEDMDQIGDRLEELGVHRKEAEVLDKAYNTYNEFLLFTESQRLLQENRLRDDEKARHDKLAAELQGIAGGIAAEKERLAQLGSERDQAGTELETLQQSEAVEKQAELERLKNEEGKIHGEITAAHKRKSDWEVRR
ncbi:MAG: TIGR02680 family protein, partial [Bacillota bacterium]